MTTINSIKELVNFIAKNSNSSAQSLPALENAILAFDTLSGESFFPQTLSKIRNLASQLNVRDFYFKIKPREFKLTRLEVAAYLANCFLCTIDTLIPAVDGYSQNDIDLNTSFETWFESSKTESAHKVLCFLQYFQTICNCRPATLAQEVHYKIHSVAPLGQGIENPHKILEVLHCDDKTDAELLQQNTAKVIFIDRETIGEDLFSESCFQEEIEMMVRPELMFASLLQGHSFQDDEAVTVKGAKRYSCHTGFGETFQFCKAVTPNTRENPTLVLTHFRVVSGSGELRQYKRKAIDSYVKSLFSALIHLQHVDKITFEFWAWRDDNASSQNEVEKAMVADPAVVILSMWIAASMAFKDVIFRQNVNVELGKSVATLYSNIGGQTIDEAYQALLKYCDLMLTNPNPMKNQNDAIFDAFKMARPGFLKFAVGKSANVYKWVEDKMHKNIAQHQNAKTIQSYTIVNVYKIYNYRLWERYCEREWEVKRDLGRDFLHNHEFKRLFHGTAAAEIITKTGFDVSRSDPEGMLGQGIYFAELSSKSVQYTYAGGFRKGCKLHNNPQCSTCPRSMLICRVLFGNKYETPNAMKYKTSPPPGYHSVEANPRSFNLHNNRPLQFLEYSVYNNYQAFPGYLVEFTVNT